MEACGHPYLPEKGPPSHSLNRSLVLSRGRLDNLEEGRTSCPYLIEERLVSQAAPPTTLFLLARTLDRAAK